MKIPNQYLLIILIETLLFMLMKLQMLLTTIPSHPSLTKPLSEQNRDLLCSMKEDVQDEPRHENEVRLSIDRRTETVQSAWPPPQKKQERNIIINIFRYISYIILAWPTLWAVLLLSVPAKYHLITIILSRDLFVNMKQQKYSFVILPESPLCTF